MDKHGVYFNKKLGQNFIIDENIISSIVERSNISPEDCIIEIGPGIGVLTKALAQRANKVIAVEIDNNLIGLLEDTLQQYDNVKIINDDVLQVDIGQEIKEEFGQKAKVIANLPYYITTPIIMKLLEETENIDEIIVMVQKEVAERLTASPGTKAYGKITVSINYYSEAEIILDVPNTSFMPKPKVDSAVIRLKVRDKPPVTIDNQDLFFKVVKATFNKRRKTMINALANSPLQLDKGLLKDIFKQVDINLKIRGEKLSIEEFAKISNALNQVLEG